MFVRFFAVAQCENHQLEIISNWPTLFSNLVNENEPYKLEERTTNLLGDVGNSGRDVLPVAPAVSPVQPRAVLVGHCSRTRYREGTTEWIVCKRVT